MLCCAGSSTSSSPGPPGPGPAPGPAARGRRRAARAGAARPGARFPRPPTPAVAAPSPAPGCWPRMLVEGTVREGGEQREGTAEGRREATLRREEGQQVGWTWGGGERGGEGHAMAAGPMGPASARALSPGGRHPPPPGPPYRVPARACGAACRPRSAAPAGRSTRPGRTGWAPARPCPCGSGPRAAQCPFLRPRAAGTVLGLASGALGRKPRGTTPAPPRPACGLRLPGPRAPHPRPCLSPVVPPFSHSAITPDPSWAGPLRGPGTHRGSDQSLLLGRQGGGPCGQDTDPVVAVSALPHQCQP
jgi:hypothetical protein